MTISSLNTRALDVEPINAIATPTPPIILSQDLLGTFNSIPMNTLVMDGAYAIVTTITATSTADIRESVGINISSSDAIIISEDVELHTIIEAGEVLRIVEDVHTLFEGRIVTVGENVHTHVPLSFFGRNGWEPVLTINGFLVPRDRICDNITIIEEENQSNQAMFSLLVADPVSFIDEVWGQPITVDYVSTTSSVRLFTGVIAIPEIDLINKRVKFICSNNRDELIANVLSPIVPTTGFYSEAVQGQLQGQTIADQMNARMKTIPYSLDFDAYNTYSLNSWYAKDIPDYTFTDSDVYYRNPKVTWQDRTKIKNSYSIGVQYQYTRLYHMRRPFSWAFPYSFCEFLQSQYSLPNISMIETAITNAKWTTPSPIIFTSVFPPGSCVDGASILLWNTNSISQQGTYSTVFDSLGNVISDPDGNNVYGFRPFTTTDDQTKLLTIGASWIGATQFSQYIIEDYSLTVESPQSINQFGTITDSLNTSLKDDFDATQWEDYTTETAIPSNAVMGSNNSYYFSEDTAPQNMTNAIITQLNIAKTDILSTHRNTQVVFETTIKPLLSLSHTVKVDGETVVAKGKVQRLVHTLDVMNGKDSKTEITLALFRSKGTQVETPVIAPPRPSDSITFPSSTIVLGNHFGETNTSFNGYIGNKNNPRVIGTLARTNVQEEFRVDVPGIDDTYREARTLPVVSVYNISIPDDLLTVVF